MSYFVSVMILEDGDIEKLVGPFSDAAVAMDWADREAALELSRNPGFIRESSEGTIVVHNNDFEEDLEGNAYQVLEAEAPVMEPVIEAEPME